LDEDARRQLYQSRPWPYFVAYDPYADLLREVESFAPLLREVGVVTVIDAGMISLALDPAAR
jgi:hypothetical protein